MPAEDSFHGLPRPITDRLHEVIRRIRRLQCIRGSLVTLSVAVGALLGVAAVDTAFSLESRPLRLVVSLTALGVTLGAAWRYWVRPVTRRITLTEVARWMEVRHPDWQERLSTAVELMEGRHGQEGGGSPELLSAVVRDAAEDVAKVDPRLELEDRHTRPARWLAYSALGLLLALVASWPKELPRLLARAVAPLSDQGNAWSGRLRVLTTSRTVALGDPVDIQAALQGGPARMELHLVMPDGRTPVEMLSPDPAVPVDAGESGYSLKLPSLREGFTARVKSGPAVSAAFTIKAVPRPETGNFSIHYHYPEYTGWPDRQETAASGEITALAGTRVSVEAALNRPVSRAQLEIGGVPVPGVRLSTPPEGQSVQWSIVLTPGLDALWSLRLEDADGIANRPVERPVRATADLPPAITLETPEAERLELRPVEKLALTYSVEEDIGLSAVQIRIRPQEGPEWLLPPAPLPDKVAERPETWQGTALLDLATVPVPNGQEIRVSLMAADRLPASQGGPQRAWSREITIRLNHAGRSQVERNLEAWHEAVRRQLEEVKRELQNARGRLNDKPERLRREEQLSTNTLKDLEAGTAHMEEAHAQLERLAASLKSSAYARQVPALEEVAKAMLSPARAAVREIPLTDVKPDRAALADNAKSLLERAIDGLEQEQRQLNQDRPALQQMARLSDLAAQQQRLAATAAQAAAPSAAAPDPPRGSAASPNAENAAATLPAPPSDAEERAWLEEQRRVADRARQLMQENLNADPEARQELLRQAAATATELSRAAEALAGREESLAKRMGTAPAQEAATSQEELARQAAGLQQRMAEFQEGAARQIDQSANAQDAAFQAAHHLETARDESRKSSQELAPAAPVPDPAGSSPHEPATAAAPPKPDTAATGAPAIAAPASGQETAASSGPDTSTDASEKPPAGQLPAQAGARALTSAAESLGGLNTELNTLAGKVGEHHNSLGSGAQQAGSAVDEAARPQNGKGRSPSMARGAQSAQKAAEELAFAASTALQSMGIPASAMSATAAPPSPGKGTPTAGQPKPGGPAGQEGQEGLQADTASSALPEAIAKLGLSGDDWTKLRSSLNGLEGSGEAQVPAEYRDLVKAYFGALSKAGTRPASKRP